MKKIVVLIIGIILLTGCSVKYRVDINEDFSVNENVLVAGTEELYSNYYKTTKKNVLKSLLDIYKSEFEENNYSWQFITIPFDYESYNSNQAESKALLVTISTNATPGQGSAAGLFSSGADSLYVDDVELIYNAVISNIALNGVALESFNFNAATKNYDITYSGEALNLTADNFVVTTEGVSAIVVKNVEDLGCGNYRIALTAVVQNIAAACLSRIVCSRFNKFELVEITAISFVAGCQKEAS